MELAMILILVLCYFILKLTRNRGTVLDKMILYYTASWIIVEVLSSFNLFSLYKVSGYATLLFLLSYIGFFLGYQLKIKTKTRVEYMTSCSQEIYGELIYSNKGFFILAAILLVPLIVFLTRFLTISSSSYALLRMARFETGVVFKTLTEALLYNYLFTPFFYIECCVVIYGLLTKKMKLPLLIVCLAGIGCYSYIGFGRLVFFELLMILIVMSMCRVSKVDFKAVRKRINPIVLIIAGIGALLLVAFITGKRLGYTTVSLGDMPFLLEKSLSQSYQYVMGAQRAFDYALSHYASLGWHFGRMTLSGIDEILCYGMTLIGVPINSMNSIYGSITQTGISVGDGVGHNALYSGIFNFYYDLGVIGVFINSLILGVFVRYFVDRFQRFRSIPNLIALCYVSFALFMMPLRWVFSSPDSVILLCICIIWDRRLRRSISRQSLPINDRNNIHEDSRLNYSI